MCLMLYFVQQITMMVVNLWLREPWTGVENVYCNVFRFFGSVLDVFIARRAFVWDPFKFWCPSVRPYVRTSVLRIFWKFYACWQAHATIFLDPYVQAKSQEAKNRSEKTEFKQERNDRPKSVFEKFLKNFPQAMHARKYRIVFYWIHMFGVKPHKNQHFQLENTSNTSDWRVRTNLNGTTQKPWGPPLPRGCNLVKIHKFAWC